MLPSGSLRQAFGNNPVCFLQEEEEGSRAGPEGTRAAYSFAQPGASEGFVQALPATVYQPPTYHPSSTPSLCFIYAPNTYLESGVVPSFFPSMRSQLSIPYHLSVTLSWRPHLQSSWVYACTHTRTHTLTNTHHIPSLLPMVYHCLFLTNILFFTYLSPVSPSIILALERQDII